MAKRGRPPKGKRVEELDATLRAEIDEAIRSRADESVASIYRRFGLAQRGVILRGFQRYVSDLRARHEGERLVASEPDVGEVSWNEIERRAMRGMLERLQAGDAKMYELALVVGRRHERERIDIEQRAEKRATELHQVKLEQLSKDLRKQVEERTEGDKSLTRADVYDLIDQVMRGT